MPAAIRWHTGPDVDRTRAELIARHLSAETELIAGRLANHLRYYFPATPLVSLPERWHEAFVRDRSVDPIALVRALVAEAGRPCVLSNDAVRFLYDIGADPLRLVATEQAFIAPEDPSVALFPVAASSGAPTK